MKLGRNYGLGDRRIEKAGKRVLDRQADKGEKSKSTAATNAGRWRQFTNWAKEREKEAAEAEGRAPRAIYLEHVTREMVIEYGRELASEVALDDMAASYAQNLVSAVNSVMNAIPLAQWKSVSPTDECGIAERVYDRSKAPETLDREVFEARLAHVRTFSERGAVVCELARELGLRSKEASLIDAKYSLKEALKTGSVPVSYGTKGGRDRDIEVTSPRQIAALEKAAALQGSDRSLIPAEQSWRQWRDNELRHVREAIGGLHELRAAYACERYEAMTVTPPHALAVEFALPKLNTMLGKR